MTELQTGWLDFAETLKIRSDTNDLARNRLTTWNNRNRRKKFLVELERCVDDRLTLLDKELHAVANGNDNGNGRKSALFNLKNTAIL